MDDETRFWIAQQVADSKNTSDIQPLFREGKQIVDKKPNVLISDGAPNFRVAYKREFLRQRIPEQSTSRTSGYKERFTITKWREWTPRLEIEKRQDTKILTGYQIYHNYLRPHEGLDGKTPAEASGIKSKERTKG